MLHRAAVVFHRFPPFPICSRRLHATWMQHDGDIQRHTPLELTILHWIELKWRNHAIAKALAVRTRVFASAITAKPRVKPDPSVTMATAAFDLDRRKLFFGHLPIYRKIPVPAPCAPRRAPPGRVSCPHWHSGPNQPLCGPSTFPHLSQCFRSSGVGGLIIRRD